LPHSLMFGETGKNLPVSLNPEDRILRLFPRLGIQMVNDPTYKLGSVQNEDPPSPHPETSPTEAPDMREAMAVSEPRPSQTHTKPQPWVPETPLPRVEIPGAFGAVVAAAMRDAAARMQATPTPPEEPPSANGRLAVHLHGKIRTRLLALGCPEAEMPREATLALLSTRLAEANVDQVLEGTQAYLDKRRADRGKLEPHAVCQVFLGVVAHMERLGRIPATGIPWRRKGPAGPPPSVPGSNGGIARAAAGPHKTPGRSQNAYALENP